MAAGMELQLSTKKAEAAIKQIEKSLVTLGSKLDGFGKRGTSVEKTFATISKFRGVNSSAVNSVKTLSDAINKLSSTQKIRKVVTDLQGLNKVNIKQSANAVAAFNKALQGIRVSRGLGRAAKDFERVSVAAKKATGNVALMNARLQTLKTPVALKQTSAAMNTVRASSFGAKAGVTAFGGAMASASGIAAAFGISLGAMGLSSVVRGATEAVFIMDRFKVIMDSVGKSTGGAATALNFINDLAARNASDIGALAEGYSKFSAAALTAGFSAKQTNTVFSKMTGVIRALKLSSDDARLVFLALEQMISKGKISMEELRRQLGERVPGAFAIMAKAVGVTTQELNRMVGNGELGSKAVIAFAEEAARAFPLMAQALETPQARLTEFTNATFRLQEAFGRGMFDAALPGIQAMTEALSSDSAKSFAKDLGLIVGSLASVIAKITAFLAQTGLLKVAFAALIGLGMAKMFGLISSTVRVMGVSVLGAGASVRGMALAFQLNVAASGLFAGSLRTVGLAARGLMTAMGPVGLILTGITLALPLIVDLYDSFTSAISGTTVSSAEMRLETERQEAAILKAAGSVAALSAEQDRLTLATEAAAKAARQAGTDGLLLVAGLEKEIVISERKITAFETMEAAQGSLTSAQKTAVDQVAELLVLQEKALVVAQKDLTANDLAIKKAQEIATEQGAVAEAYRQAAAAAGEASGETGILQGIMDSISGLFGITATETENTATNMAMMGESSTIASSALNSFGDNLSKVASTAPKAATGIGNAATSSNELDSSSGNASGSVSSLSGSLDNSASSAISAAAAYREAAVAAREMADAGGGGGGGGSGGSSGAGNGGGAFSSKFFAKGGLSHGPAPTKKVPASVFVGAPSFADGSANVGGGIPAILHPGEAVVPLPDGGSIPVDMNTGANTPTGGGGSDQRKGNLFLKKLTEMTDVLYGIENEVAQIRDTDKVLNSLLRQELINIGDTLIDMNLGVNTLISKAGSGGFGGGGSGSGLSGGGGNGGGGSGGVTGNDRRFGGGSGSLAGGGMQSVTEKLSFAKFLLNSPLNPIQSGLSGIKSALGLFSSATDSEIMSSPLWDALDFFSQIDLNSLGSLNSPQRTTLISQAGLSGGFADGSPNVFKEATGQSVQVKVHKNEAVVPLPDGRTIPIKLPKNVLDNQGAIGGISREISMLTKRINNISVDNFGTNSINEMSGAIRNLNQRGSESNRGTIMPPVVINMTVNATDAASFKNSQKQIAVDLAADIEQANRQIGNKVRGDDPTKRV